MSFQLMLHEGGRTGLEAVCDVCGKLVKDPVEAVLCWEPEGKNIGEFFQYKIACKEECLNKLENQNTQELEPAIGYLLNNCGIDYPRMIETLKTYREFNL